MTFGLRVLPSADDDVDDIAFTIAHDSIEQATRFYDAVNETYKMILEAPARWPVYPSLNPRLGELHKRSVVGFPNHLVFYRIDVDMVEVIRVVHGARDLPALFEDMK